MEGPTPVSALIHAATLVTAGVFLVIRCSSLFEESPTTLLIVALIGAMTAFFAATVGLVQNDLKKVIAYSTCSQLGFMVFACGLSHYSVALFHLANHALFKALLFLSAGCIIHGLMDEQDLRKMGAVIRLLPMSYTMVLIGSLALVGFPFLTGFYSKDVILEIALTTPSTIGNFAHWLGCLAAFCTSFYSFRLIFLTFINETNANKTYVENAHDAPIKMAFPLMILAIGSVF
jgi:NADH-ubiquinone oxidoreductase chain 5